MNHVELPTGRAAVSCEILTAALVPSAGRHSQNPMRASEFARGAQGATS